MSDSLIKYLEWDSDFFGFPIARLQSPHLNPDIISQCEDWCRERNIRCLYYLANADDRESVILAEDHHFRLVDIRLTFQRNFSEQDIFDPGTIPIRSATRPDIESLKAIAKDSYTDTRFYCDANFPRHLCGLLYETWIEKSVLGDAQLVVVSETDLQVSGYVTCHLNTDLVGQIGLVGVTSNARGCGVAGALLQAGLDWYTRQGVKTVKVITQGRNIAAQRLYQRFGFLSQCVQLWYHRWFY